MDGWRTTENSIKPQLVVKIVGGKHIKYFIDGSKSSEDRNNSSNKVTDEDLSRKSPSYDLRPAEHKDNLLDALQQFPDRRCVTAPCGDRSQSYIYPKSTTNPSSSKQLLQNPHFTEEQSEDPQHGLLTCLSEELQDLEQNKLELMEQEVTSLDSSGSGLLHQSELMFLLLKLKVPVKLRTLACVIRKFSDTTDPLQVHYRELLKFIQRAAQDDNQPSVEAEICNASVADTDLESVSVRSENAENGETWLQRFQKMEMALRMCDTKNTGYVDRDQAKRLILNYSLIFDLDLSPVKVSEVTRSTQREGRVHLASALQQLKER
ncbi:uncharacterized protein C1orf87 homolog isoform X2 [Danio rerio]|uniref:Uncharacterized protein C1orf87 homolog isoform X2 n=1 Tax=Danio rerio TaxID=7955 RepID=A0AC58IMP6_DANRE|nr:uncharacterized protein C1orf87 homolog isoform X2 [Danio rerio]|eukprot:XP_009295390.1 uncharacterized protein C1orf87 homolog isoform X2 [Danio rerio]